MARVDALLDELLDLPAGQRIAALRAKQLPDPELLDEIESLLRAAEESRDFMTAPPVANFDAASVFAPAPQAAAPDVAIGSRFGAWRILRLIGTGGMGEVHEAARVTGDFERRVAIKLLRRDVDTQLERFQSERQILAKLEHPGIARLYDGGVTADGRPFMVMEYVEGRTITDYCRQTQAALPKRMQLFVQVCEAVAFAHRNLIVHRDLKPSNILVTDMGTVKLLDFGIAKLLDAQRAQATMTATAPMTLLCAAPEQLSGEAVTTAADVYTLGLLLFELLTGVHPWVGRDTPVMQAMRTMLEEHAPRASDVAASRPDCPVPVRLIRGDFDAIVNKALRREPSHRYPSVSALELDVRKALAGEPVEARDGARLYVIGRTLLRYRWAVAAAAAVMLSLATGLGVAAYQAKRAAIERDSARRDAAREEAVRYSLTQMFRAAIADQGSQTPTAKAMIDASAQRVLREYRDHPQLSGEIVLTLADLYSALEDVNGAWALLDGFVAEATEDTDPAALADARQKLANIELLRGHSDRADQLLSQATAFWARWPNLYREQRLEGLSVKVRLQRGRGDLAGAIEATREAIAQRIELSGHDHRETAILYNSLAISLSAANRLSEALDAYHETSAIYRALGLGDGLDAQIILANTGTLELKVGHLLQAETLLKGAVERERALAGDSAAVAAAMGGYGRILSITNRNAGAVAVLRDATDMANRFAGAGSPVAVQNALFLGEAQLNSGDVAGAAATLESARAIALKQYGPAHLITLRSELTLAGVTAASGHWQAAQAQCNEAAAGLRKLGVAGEPHLAQALLLLGEFALSQGHGADATLMFREAVALREKYPDDVWELAQARERLGEALASTGADRVAAAAMISKAAQDLESQLGSSHPQTLRAKAAMANLLASNPTA
jgi:non-specific serine/threonine protein kinase/serine/threonine-protein kinase